MRLPFLSMPYYLVLFKLQNYNILAGGVKRTIWERDSREVLCWQAYPWWCEDGRYLADSPKYGEAD